MGWNRHKAAIVGLAAATLPLSLFVPGPARADDAQLKKLNSQASQAYLARQFDAAEKSYQDAIKLLSPSQKRLAIVLWSNLGAVYRDDHKYDLSETSFQKALAIAANSNLSSDAITKTAMKQYAVLLRRQNRQFDASEMEARAAASAPAPIATGKRLPDAPPSAQNKSTAVLEAKVNGKEPIHIDPNTMTVEEIQKAVNHNEEAPIYWIGIARRYQIDKDFEHALSAYRTFLRKWPDRAKTFRGELADCLAKSGNFPDAIAEQKTVISENPEDPQPYLVLISYYFHSGNEAAQLEAMDQYILKFPSGPDVDKIRASVDYMKKDQASRAKGTTNSAKYLTWSYQSMPLKVFVENGDSTLEDLEPSSDVTENTPSTLVERAEREWTQASQGKINFQQAPNVESSNIIVSFTDDEGNMESENAQGITIPPEQGTLKPVQIRVLTVHRNGTKLSLAELMEVILHEMGHSLGMDHVSDLNAVMYHGVHKKPIVALTPQDVQALTDLYNKRAELFGGK